MGFEKSGANPYEPLLRASDGKLVKESELDLYEEALLENEEEDEGDEQYVIEHNESDQKPKGISRRTFLKGLGAGAVAYGLERAGVFDNIDLEEIGEKVGDTLEWFEGAQEKSPETRTPTEQLLEEGHVTDLVAGIEAIWQRHFAHLTETKKGRADMHAATKNLSKLDLERLIKPFTAFGLPPQLCYMIAIQETRARNLTSWAGARGLMGIMPSTAKAYGYQPDAARDPYKASEIAAKYCKDEQGRFGNQGDMILHAYNGGGGLFGFTEQTAKKERTTENFYHYMEDRMSQKLREYEEEGLTVFVRKKDTLYGLSKKFGVKLNELLHANGLIEQSIIHEGQQLEVPFQRNKEMLEMVFRKELEVLRYAPEVKAKYAALKEHGFLAQIESELGDTSHLG